MKPENYYIGMKNENVHIVSSIIKGMNYIKKDNENTIIKLKIQVKYWSMKILMKI